ncbi:hypothetical protein Clo1100_3921 [Clostridium sp. BNL1100]|nr:hypothetical protein Clo1100_3921 [Clostridium sp. BNL1100]
MNCRHFEKAKLIKRVKGVQGYCNLHKIDILNYHKINYSPYFKCKSKNGKSYEGCSGEIID